MPNLIDPARTVKKRWSTRLASLYALMVKKQRIRAIPIDCRALAARLGCSYQTMVRLTGDFAQGKRRTVWSFNGYGFVVWMRYRRHRSAKCGHPQFYLSNRYALHTIGGNPRARLRQKLPSQWKAYLALIKKLAFGKILRGRERANDKHKASHHIGTGGGLRARPPPTANRAGLRRFHRIAVEIEKELREVFAATGTAAHGWILNRLGEWHRRERIVEMVRHAHHVMPKGRFRPANSHAWLCAVAERHLDLDGLGRIQRRREIEGRKIEKVRRSAPTFRVEKPELKSEVEVKWKNEYNRIMSKRIIPPWEKE